MGTTFNASREAGSRGSLVRYFLGQRWRQYERLDELQAMLASIVESSDDAIISKTLEGVITSWNAAAERIFGYTADEMIGSSITKLIPEDRQQEEVEILAKIQRGEKVNDFETIRVRKNGSRLYVSATISPLRDRKGRIIGASKIVRDITARKEMEDALRRLNDELEERVEERTAEIRRQEQTNRLVLENLAEGVMACDASGSLVLFNRAAREWHGIAGGPVAVPQESWHEADGLATLDPSRAPLARALRGERLRNVELSIVRPNMPARLLWASGGPILDNEGRKCGAVVVLRDITERKRNEQMLHRSQRLESLGTLAAGVAHDLNNALAPIMMGTELLRMRYPEEGHIVGNIQDSAKRGAGMVRQLLTFARGADGARVSVDVAKLIRELANIMHGTFPMDIEVEVEVGEGSLRVCGDSTQLHQVLLNLCVNARDAMPQGGTLRLSARKMHLDDVYVRFFSKANPGDYVVIRVADTGVGIAPEIQDRIFEPFFTTKGPDQGTGLGLSTSIGLVKAHGGFLQVQSKPGEGTTFTVYLPVEEKTNYGEAPALSVSRFKGKGETILFVDDEPGVREVGRAVLERLNFRVIPARDGVDGLIRAAEHRTDLRAVLTDLQMPNMDGIRLIQGLRRMLPDIPILAFTGRLDEQARKELLDLDVRVQLAKPFAETELAEAMRLIFERPRAEPSARPQESASRRVSNASRQAIQMGRAKGT